MDEIENVQRMKLAKTLALISMLVVLLSIPLAAVFDFISLKDVILQFIAALIIPIIAFFVLCVAMIASIIFIFGIFLIEEYGFWPLTLSIDFFKEIIGDIKVTPEAIQLFSIFRIILIVICVAMIVLAIVSKVIGSDNGEQEFTPEGKPIKKKNPAKGMSTVAIVFAILGIVVSVGALLISARV